MKPLSHFILLALATGLGGCQGLAQTPTRVHASATPAPTKAQADPLGEPGQPAQVDEDEQRANLDDFYRDKLGIDPRILYARRAVEAGSAAGH